MWHKIPSDQHVLKVARLQLIKREEYSTVKVCNLVFFCVVLIRTAIFISQILLFCYGLRHTIVCSFHLGDDDFGSIVLYCLLIVVGSFWKRVASPRSVFKCPVHKPYLTPKIQHQIKLNRNLVNTTGVRCVPWAKWCWATQLTRIRRWNFWTRIWNFSTKGRR